MVMYIYIYIYIYKLITFAYEYTIINFLMKPPEAFAWLLGCSGIFKFWHKFHRIVLKLLERLEDYPR